MTDPIQHLRELMAKATPLYSVPSAYFDREENESVANLFARDKAGECVVQVRGDFARDWARALVMLPQLLEVVESARDIAEHQDLNWSDTIEHRQRREARLLAALAALGGKGGGG